MNMAALEEFVWENWADELLQTLDSENREILQRYFGIFPYQPHSVSAISRLLGIPYMTAYRRIRKILKGLRKEIIKTLK